MNGPLIPSLEERCRHLTVEDVRRESEVGVTYMMGTCVCCKEEVYLGQGYKRDGTPATYVRKSKD